MKIHSPGALLASPLPIVLVLAFVAGCSGDSKPAAEPKAAAAPRPALTVRLTTPQTLDWPQSLPANGNVVAWQEAVIGPEIANYRVTDVRVQVGDRVKKGQVLARIADDTVASEQAEAKAAVAELEASAAEAKANAERARDLREKGFYSAQLNTQYQTALHTAQARLAAGQVDVMVSFGHIRIKNAPKWESELGGTAPMVEQTGVIGVTAPIYNDTISVSKNSPIMDADLIAALQKAFINIGNTDAGKQVIAIYSHNGYQVAQSSDYDNERAAQKLIQELSAAN